MSDVKYVKVVREACNIPTTLVPRSGIQLEETTNPGAELNFSEDL